MNVSILLISNTKGDKDKLKNILGDDQHNIYQAPFNEDIEKVLSKNTHPLILADFDLVHDRIDLFYDLQQGLSKACLIFYGDRITSEELSQLLQKGIYAYIPRKLLKERLKETILSGLENRRALIEILDMMDDLKELNSRLEIEKKSLKTRNQQLSFINHLSTEISYDVNWDRILQRMINAGLEKTMEYQLFGLLFRMGQKWHLTLHMAEFKNIADRDKFISDIIERANSDYSLDISIMDIEFYQIDMMDIKNSYPENLHDFNVIPLDYAGEILGHIVYKGGKLDNSFEEAEALFNTLANMLSLSLKNAQEYFELREAAMTDSLTGVYNRKGLLDFLEKELSRAERYNKSISFVMADMDDFKKINDSMGHQAGDYVLRVTSAILKKILSPA